MFDTRFLLHALDAGRFRGTIATASIAGRVVDDKRFGTLAFLQRHIRCRLVDAMAFRMIFKHSFLDEILAQ